MSPRISVIVPVRNGGERFARCLAALSASRFRDYELIVVDDGSSDGSAEQAWQAGATVHAVPPDASPAGPAGARNLGARRAKGEWLFFVDADVEVRPEALAQISGAFDADPTLAAVFGSYDDAPAETNFLSQYKNLFHHFVHQSAHEQASTFWAGCGAIRREVFLGLNGFDDRTYRRPSIEDIELGYRLVRQGGRVKLLHDLQVKHLKRWTAFNLIKVDIFDRGVPWTRLLWRESLLPRPARAPGLLDLNLQRSNRISVVLCYLLLLAGLAAVLLPAAGLLIPPASVTLLWLNRRLYGFFYQKRGLAFLLMALPWHLLYYFYNGVCFALGTVEYVRLGAPAGAFSGSWAADES